MKKSEKAQNLPQIRIFLSGSVHKGKEDIRESRFFWSDAEEQLLKNAVPTAYITILNPNKVSIDRSRYMERFRADLEMVLEADLVLVDLRTKKGLGVGAELMMARYEGIPIVGLCPDGAAYRNGNQLHAFAGGLVTHLCDDLKEVSEWILSLIKSGQLPITHKNCTAQAAILFGLEDRRKRE